MKLVRYSEGVDAAVRTGWLTAEGVRPLAAGVTMPEALGSVGSGILDGATAPAPIPLERLHLHSPVDVPPSLRDFMSFEDHVVTSMSALGRQVDPIWYQQPVFYFSNPAAVIGPSADVPVAPGSSEFDFELEIGAVIGTPGSDIPASEAERHIAGYAILCDWSARDLQEREMRVGLGPAKGKDTATTIGPWLITPDELEPLRTPRGFDIDFTVHVNGRLYSRGNWSTIHWTFPQMVAYASRGTTLRSGDVIGSGTIGTGCILELGRVHGFERYPYLCPGDVVRIDGGPLGTISQTIVAGPEPATL
ncbi:fumarylacetoacetate hydrolase family protein [Georgenia sp. AZ-5]|uniref:fumarylacetoacetate hydrolase family protein n=1 Tax=Georgenia sp. AZ-5 TaxID=3367526 RepID=UPI0037548E6A